jgi:hypothetical protein
MSKTIVSGRQSTIVRQVRCPDAHYNLARIRELEGDEVNARRHLRLYHRLIDQEHVLTQRI